MLEQMTSGHRFSSWLATKLFGEPDDLNRAADCPPYLKRWRIWASPDDNEPKDPKDPFRVYLHRFDGCDWATDPHDHPKRFWSIGLWGSYYEFTPSNAFAVHLCDQRKLFKAPWFRSFPAEHIHRIGMPVGVPHCWTLVFTGKYTKGWGFFMRNGGYMKSRDYFETELRDCTGDNDNAG